MKSCFRIFGAIIVGFIFSAPLVNGGDGASWNPIAKPAHAALIDTEITDLLDRVKNLPAESRNMIHNVNPTIFQELSALSSTDLTNLKNLNLKTLNGFPGLSNASLSALANLPNNAVDGLLDLDVGSLGNMGQLSATALGQINDFVKLGNNLNLDANTLLGQFNTVLGGDLNSLLDTTDIFSGFDIGNLNTIAGNLGVDFGDLAENLTKSINVDLGEFINLDFSKLNGLGVNNLNDLIGQLGLPSSVLDNLAGDLGTTVTNLLNTNLNNLNLLNIGNVDDLANLVGLDPNQFINNLTTSLGGNPLTFLDDFTGGFDFDVNNILGLDLSALSDLGINNLTDLSGILGIPTDTLLADLSSAFNIPVPDLAGLSLNNLMNTFNLNNIADFGSILGVAPDNILNGISVALGVDISSFTDIGIEALKNLGFDNAFDLIDSLGIDLTSFSNLTGLTADILAGMSIQDLSDAFGGALSLGAITGLTGGSLASVINNLGGALGLPTILPVGVPIGNSYTYTVSGGSDCNSVSAWGNFCNGTVECDCNGMGISSSVPGGCCSVAGNPFGRYNGSCTGAGSCPFTDTTCTLVTEAHQSVLKPFWDIEMFENERWMTQDWLAGYILPSLMSMTEELSAVAMQHVVIIGSFFDAQLELDTQRALQEIQAQAHKDYHPSEGVCVFATNVRGLAMTQRRTDLTQTIVSNRAINRHLGIENDGGSEGPAADLGSQKLSFTDGVEYRTGRLEQFQDQYCNPRDINEKMRFLCDKGLATDAEPERMNLDINYYENFASQKTLLIDFLKPEAEATDEEKQFYLDYIALSKNLYGHKVPFRNVADDFDVPPDFELSEESFADHPFSNYLNLRAMAAKRSVAENSFHAQTALKSTGDASASTYMYALLSQLGLQAEDIDTYMQGGPSYYAQMEILTKKIYQNPDFYINLYDKPANVKRKQVALKAIGLMQDFDTLEVELRSEMLAAQLLELGLAETQFRMMNDEGQ